MYASVVVAAVDLAEKVIDRKCDRTFLFDAMWKTKEKMPWDADITVKIYAATFAVVASSVSMRNPEIHVSPMVTVRLIVPRIQKLADFALRTTATVRFGFSARRYDFRIDITSATELNCRNKKYANNYTIFSNFDLENANAT